ncbi:hypothetical protein AURDEDRAFT_177230 [Auricularia subglabra TFB-10046 SS5]|uniref:WW domain-containing protein n=1 Tax=Auricularia subglabra (strain TFB-10046 / SS5) TaxID=717982 RepID=J0D4L1_AURST|nr:hypothetical protein AURDEDRAFT_177230 [Auricularia subglabra TFB-10046 SS5]
MLAPFALLGLAALSLLARATDGDPPGQDARPPTPIPEDMAATTELVSDAQWAPSPECWELDTIYQSTLFPGETRYFARRWTGPTTSWIAPNSFTRGVPLAPTCDGPRLCGCLDIRGRATSVYGQQENARPWPWMADWYDPAHPHRPYAANIWMGMGPCPRAGQTSVLHRFPATIADSGDTSWFWISGDAQREMEAQENLDEGMLPLLFTQEQRDALPSVRRLVHEGAQHLAILRARWAAWVYSLLDRRARIIYQLIGQYAARALQTGHAARLAQLRDRRYFGGGPQGAWFDDVIRDAPVIRRFITEGVPVYYRWEVGYEAMPFLADLAPPPGPAPNSPRRLPPPTPSRFRHNAGPALTRNHARHYDSIRHPPSVAYTLADGRPYVADDIDLHMLMPLDPNVPAPPRPQERERNDSPISMGDSSSDGMDDSLITDASGIELTPPVHPRPPPLALRLDSAATINLVRAGLRVSGDLVYRARTPESPTEDVRGRQRPAGSTRSLASRINLHADAPDAESRLAAPSIFDFLQEGDGGVDVGPFVSAPRREPVFWTLNVLEHERAPARARMLQLIQDGTLTGHAQELEYAERRGMAYMTAGLFPSGPNVDARGLVTIPNGDPDAHVVPRMDRLSPDTPDGQTLYTWAQGVRLVLSRPHARAALARGGLIWRIARWAGLTPEHAREGPSREAREEGSSRYLVQNGLDGRPAVLTDDWLSQEEVDTLLGVELGSSRALWPDPGLIQHNWWQGEWTEQHEAWFLE